MDKKGFCDKFTPKVRRILLIIYTFGLFALNFIRIFDNNFWGDEGFTIRLSKLSVADMLTATARDVHPPLYYFAVIAGYKLFGAQGWMYHLASVIPYAVILIVALTLFYKKFGEITAALFITFASLLESAFRYNVEARMYSLAALFVLLSFYELYKIITDSNVISYVLFVLFSLCAAYTHYYAMISVAVFYALLLVLVAMKKEKIGHVLLIYAVTVIGYLPWLGKMYTTFERTADSFWMTDYDGILLSLEYIFKTQKAWLSLGLLAVTIILLILNIRKFSDITLWAIFGLTSVILTIIAGQLISVFIHPSYITRYIYPVSIVIWLILGVLTEQIADSKIRLAVFGTVLFITGGICGIYSLLTIRGEYRENLRCEETQKTILSMVGNNDLVITDIDHMAWTLLDYYIPDTEYILDTSHSCEPDVSKRCWLLLGESADDEDRTWADSYGYELIPAIENGLLGTTDINLYELTAYISD